MNSSAYLARLPELAVIEATGADAASFLHGQLTNDVSGLTAGQARLAGYCTAKGRLLGTMVMWRDDRGEAPVYRALVQADIAASLIKRLSMFVLRAKVSLTMSDALVYGVIAVSGQDGSPAEPLGIPAAPAGPWDIVQSGNGTWISAPAPAADEQRWWLVLPTGEAPADTGPAARWRQQDIATGLPWVQAATQDLFIPQTLNLDLIDGVSFTKGCYPGQEVVARSHYRGTVKRRMAYGVVDEAGTPDAASLAGIDTFDANRPDNPCGRVVNAVLLGPALHLLMEVQLGDLDKADFRLGQADGPVIRVQALPYSIQHTE